MKSRALRYALLMLFAGAIGGAIYAIWNEESQGSAAARRARAFDERTRLVARSLLEIKSAQPGYVAAGQGDEFWAARVDALLATAREGLSALRLAAHADTRGDVDTAIAAFEDFEQMDRRAREYAREDQRLLASDLVFSDGIEKMDAGIAALDRARSSEIAAADARVALQRRSQAIAAAGVSALGLLLIFVLAPLPHQEPPAAADLPAPPERIVAPPPRRVVAAPEPPPAPAPLAAPPAPIVAPSAPPAPAVDLPGIASLCTDLARVIDMRALPAALERAATLLDASGIVIWVSDPDGRELAPIIAHGYPQHLVARIGNIEKDAENATAAAFRTGVVQTVKADGGSAGAIAAPLITPTGPVGVMAAELRRDAERRSDTRAAATILAAQLATLMGPPTPRTQGRAEAAGA